MRQDNPYHEAAAIVTRSTQQEFENLSITGEPSHLFPPSVVRWGTLQTRNDVASLLVYAAGLSDQLLEAKKLLKVVIWLLGAILVALISIAL